MRCFICFLLFFTSSAQADYISDQDKLIIGKKLWVYYDKDSCRQDLKIYPGYSDSDAYTFNEPVEVDVEELDNTPFNWHAGSWYVLKLINNSSKKAYIVYNDLNANHGFTKHLYFNEDKIIDMVLLKNACVSNISPKQRDELLLNDQKMIEKKQKEIDIEDEKKRIANNEIKEIEKKKALELENEQNKLQADENAKRSEENRILLLKNAPDKLKKLSEDTFCDYYGNYLRNERLAGFGDSDDMKIFMVKEAKRRALKFNNVSLIKDQKIKLGITSCELYASWGEANSINRSVGSFGVHIQHVYSEYGTYVYTENGYVTSWQD